MALTQANGPDRVVRTQTGLADASLLDDRLWCARDTMIPWISSAVPLDGARVFEFGCGHGLIAQALSTCVDSVHGVDIDVEAVRIGRQVLEQQGIANVTLEARQEGDILAALAERRGDVDIVLLYAVLEHLTVGERIELIGTAIEVAGPNGHVVVIETPNRLNSFDAHSAQLPYFTWLPPDLAGRYGERSQRADLQQLLDQARSQGREAVDSFWVRFGTGVSFHEFELLLGDELPRHVVAGGYDTAMYATRPVIPGEIALASDLARQRPDLRGPWSRYWLDLVLSGSPAPAVPKLLTPWVPETVSSDNVGIDRVGNLHVTDASSVLRVVPDEASGRLLVGLWAEDGPVEVTVSFDGRVVTEVLIGASAAPGCGRYFELDCYEVSTSFELSFERPAVVFAVAVES